MARIVRHLPIDGSSARVASSSAGGAQTVTLGASTANKRWLLSEVVWSVDAAPSSTPITVFDGTSTGGIIAKWDVGSSGHDAIMFPPLRGSLNTAMTVILSSASTGQMYLNVFADLDD